MTTVLKKSQVAVDRDEYKALLYLRDVTFDGLTQEHEALRVKVAKLEQQKVELVDINARQVAFIQSVTLEAGHLRSLNEILTRQVAGLSSNQDAVAAAARITELERTVADQAVRLKQAEGTQLFVNNQRLTDENQRLRKQLKDAGPVAVAVTPPPIQNAILASVNPVETQMVRSLTGSPVNHVPPSPAELISQSADFAAKQRAQRNSK